MLEESKLTASDVMMRDPITVTADTSLRHVAKLLARHRISGVPVVDANRHIVGIVTENDLMQWSDKPGEKQAWWLDMLAGGYDLSPAWLDAIQTEREIVRGVMSMDVVSVAEACPLSDVAKLLVAESIKRVPVVRDGELVGIVSRVDLVRALAQS